MTGEAYSDGRQTRVQNPRDERDRYADHWLYRCFDAQGTLLYVGITTTGVKRFRVHGNRADWWPQVANIAVEHHPDEATVRKAEIATIKRERPTHNIDFNGQDERVPAIWRRCRFCEAHFRPEPGYKVKWCCPDCRAAGKTLRGASR